MKRHNLNGQSIYGGAADQIDTSRRIRKLLDENPIVGPGQQLWMTLAKGLNVAGANNEQTIASTQALMSELARVTQDKDHDVPTIEPEVKPKRGKRK